LRKRFPVASKMAKLMNHHDTHFYLRSSVSIVIFIRTRNLQQSRPPANSHAVIQGKSEEDSWTKYAAFPKPNVAVVATDKDYPEE
jgi:hypothetical protein